MKKLFIGLFLLALSTTTWSANQANKNTQINIEQTNLGPVAPGEAENF